ncbi:MAG: lipid A biosynthesis (KDO)2-(lauroyl)-lipid IVA acyltransferase [Bacteroidales bacterium]|nr:lipid A biosynthesis (KDO)2-(lauroyl)-lipid IVA acyltransferase [Bacteroidales bacterium]
MNSENRQWTGKTGGGSLGQKILFWMLSRIQVRFFYPILYIVVPFYMLFGRKGYRAMIAYFCNHFGKNKWQAFCSTYKNHIVFGQVVLDKFAILAGNFSQFRLSVDNIDALNQALDKSEGFFVVSAHVGNFELSGVTFRQNKKKLNGIVYGGEVQTLQQRRNEVFNQSNMNFISVTNDMSHLFIIKDAIENGEIVTIHGDRLFGSPKSYYTDFINKSAKFPIGAFRLATQLDAAVYTVFIMKEKGVSYKGYVTQLNPLKDENSSIKKAEHLGKQYAAALEKVVLQYPEQWFNFYDFWNEIE